MKVTDSIEYSVVIPIYNEEKSLLPLYYSIRNVMSEIKYPYEIIFINDGSTDNSLDILKSISSKSNDVILVNLTENYGQSTAMQAGFDFSTGKIIITIDGDLQNDPRDIPRLLDKMRQGYDVVCGWRHDRHDPFLKRISAKIANVFRRLFWKEKIHDVGCTLRVYLRRTLKDIHLYRHRHRFLTFILLRKGFKIGEIKIKHHPRRFGKSKYSVFGCSIQSIIDLCFFIFLPRSIDSVGQKLYRVKEIVKNGISIYP